MASTDNKPTERESSEEPTETGAADAPPARGNPPASKKYGWILIVGLQFGLVAGAYQLGSLITPESTPGNSQKPPKTTSTTSITDPDPTPASTNPESITAADIRDRPRAVVQTCEQMLKAAPGAKVRTKIQIRKGLAHEQLGEWDRARSAYESIRPKNPYSGIALIKKLGIARSLIQGGKEKLAKEHLSPLILSSAHAQLRDGPALADARYLLAIAGARQLSLSPGKQGFSPRAPLSLPDVGPLPGAHTLDWITEEQPPTEEVSSRDELRIEAQKNPNPATCLITVKSGVVNLVTVIHRLEQACGFKTVWTAKAKEEIEHRSSSIDCELLVLSEVLRHLLEPHQLVIQFHGKNLHVSTMEEMDSASAERLMRELTRNSFRQALLHEPDHPIAPMSYFELGGLEWQDGQFQMARQWYDQCTKVESVPMLIPSAYYNLGMAQRELGEHVTARRSFYRAIDEAPNNPTAAYGFYQAGLTSILNAEPEKAIRPLRRSAALTKNKAHQGLCTLELAKAYILAGREIEVARLLQENRRVLRSKHIQDVAFLSALAAFRSTNHAAHARQARDQLVKALVSSSTRKEVDPITTILQGDAYLELGLRSQMLQQYNIAVERIHGSYGYDLRLKAAKIAMQTGKLVWARSHFEKLQKTGQQPWRKAGDLGLAELTLVQNQPEACLQYCYSLISIYREGAAYVELLTLMARAYTKLGQLEKAVQCLEGRIPDKPQW